MAKNLQNFAEFSVKNIAIMEWAAPTGQERYYSSALWL